MPKIATNLKQVRDITAKVVKGREDYVYQTPKDMQQYEGDPSCFYVHTNTDAMRTPKGAGCIVGTVLHELGVPLEALQEFERSAAYVPIGALLSAGTGVELDAIESYLTTAQIAQDQRMTWGEALASAERSAVTPAPAL